MKSRVKRFWAGAVVLAGLAAGGAWVSATAPGSAPAATAGPPMPSASSATHGVAAPALADRARMATGRVSTAGPAAAASAAALASATPSQALRALTRCYAADNCRLTRGEGLDEHFAVVGLVLQQLERLAAQGSPAEQAAWARELLAFPDGHVQAAALALAARLPPSADTVAAAVSALAKTYDAVLLGKAYPVLQQWQQLGLNSGYDDMLLGLVHTGGWQAAQSVADNVRPFLNAGNVGRFAQVARELPPGARQQSLLRALRDYQLLQQGG